MMPVSSRVGVSFLIPVHNGEPFLRAVLDAVLAEAAAHPAFVVEIIAVDDGGGDGSRAILDTYAAAGKVRIVDGAHHGAAAALNVGIRAASHAIICQVDQDVIIKPGWLPTLVAALADPAVAAAQGYYETPTDGSLWAKTMGYDVQLRYEDIRGDDVDHVCTGNAAYRRQALLDVGLFDESFGYGYDNDMSYRLAAAGHRLVICREARSIHRWKNRLWAYLRQQYGQGYGRLDLVAKHPRHVHGDIVSRTLMMAHAPLTALALVLILLSPVSRIVWSTYLPLYLGLALLGGLGLERLVAGIRAARRFSSWAPLGFVVAHLLRDVAWSVAIVRWTIRRTVGVPRRPTQSM